MPRYCPQGFIAFLPLEACRDCPQYDPELELCRWYHPPRPLSEILDDSERLERLELLTSDLREQVKDQREHLEDLKAQLGKAGRAPGKPAPPKLTGGVKL